MPTVNGTGRLKRRDNNDNKMIVVASKYAHDLGWLDRSIYAIDSTEGPDAFSLSHPMPHQNEGDL